MKDFAVTIFFFQNASQMEKLQAWHTDGQLNRGG